jgi:adenine-specific DNA-methyltransferase
MSKLIQKSKNKYGQYFTPQLIVDYMISLSSINKKSTILEPSSGKGVFIDTLVKGGYKNIIGYEVDAALSENSPFVINESFVSVNIDKKFNLIIGNPPYIRWKNLEPELKEELNNNNLWNEYANSLCDYSYIFIIKSVELLKNGGELIFITPEYWLNTTHSQKLRNYMIENGYFEKIIHFNETKIFEKASVSTIIFKFIKSKSRSKPKIQLIKHHSHRILREKTIQDIKEKSDKGCVTHFKIGQFEKNKRWLLASEDVKKELRNFEEFCLVKEKGKPLKSRLFCTIGDVCEVGNGMVSGLDKAFQIHNIDGLNKDEKKNLLKVVKAKNLIPYFYKDITHYIFLKNVKDEKELKESYPNFYDHFSEYKSKLQERYEYKRDGGVTPYWEWSFLRNFKLFVKDEKRIFVPCKERISIKKYFRFSIVESGLFPTQDVAALFKKEHVAESIYYILAFLNDKRVFDWLSVNGIVKGSIVEFSSGPISSIPFRSIDWNNEKEVLLHNEIVTLTKLNIKNNNNSTEISNKINQLFIK